MDAMVKRFSVKAKAAQRGHEGERLIGGTLSVDGVKTVDYRDGDWGGPADIDVLNTDKWTEVQAWIKTLPAYPSHGVAELKMDDELLLSLLVGVADFRRDIEAAIKRAHKKDWCLVLKPDHAGGAYATLSNTPSLESAREYFNRKPENFKGVVTSFEPQFIDMIVRRYADDQYRGEYANILL